MLQRSIITMNRQLQIWDDWDAHDQADAFARWEEGHWRNSCQVSRVPCDQVNLFTSMGKTGLGEVNHKQNKCQIDRAVQVQNEFKEDHKENKSQIDRVVQEQTEFKKDFQQSKCQVQAVVQDQMTLFTDMRGTEFRDHHKQNKYQVQADVQVQITPLPAMRNVEFRDHHTQNKRLVRRVVQDQMNPVTDMKETELGEDHRKQKKRRVRRIVQDRMNPFTAMSDTEFVDAFRLTKDSAHNLIQEIQEDLPVTYDMRGSPVPPHLQILIAIRCIASGGHQATIGDCYNVSQTRVSQCFSVVSRVIASKSKHYIKFPVGDDLQRTMRQFYQLGQIPDVIGAVGCTDIAIMRPSCDNPELFRCRKGFYSLNVQGICGPDLTFYNIVARWPGGVDDGQIFDDSRICATLEEGSMPGHLLGNSGYPCRNYLLTPVAVPSNSQEEFYNQSHIKTQSTIEKAFGALKRRFAYLDTTMRTRLDNTKAVIVAAVVLHNIAVKTKLVLAEEIEEATVNEVPVGNWYEGDSDDAQGRLKRLQIIQTHF